jgi:hypothetical protein
MKGTRHKILSMLALLFTSVAVAQNLQSAPIDAGPAGPIQTRT